MGIMMACELRYKKTTGYLEFQLMNSLQQGFK